MTAAVVSLPMPIQVVESSAEARKRRREIITTQRTIVDALPKTCSISSVATEVTAKRRKVSKDDKQKAKKPQMKYDPEVPMTKEEAAVWRREQRRKRNRESAAASRQRQRDRITELEGEVEDWKQQYESMMKKIEELEKEHGKSVEDYMTTEQLQSVIEVQRSIFVSPPSSPGYSPLSASDAEPSPVASSSFMGKVKNIPEDYSKSFVGQVEDEHSVKMISRQAVKIPDAPTLPLFPTSDDAILPPETVLSVPPIGKLDPIDSSLFPVKEVKLPALLSDEETEDEFGEFLLDAVQWL